MASPPRWVLSAVVALEACSVKRTEPPVEKPSAPPVVPRVERFAASVAGFEGDQMVSCLDFVLDVTPGDAGFDRTKTEKGFGELVSTMTKKPKGPALTKISKLCSQQFADRDPFARCTLNIDAGTTGKLTMTEAFYSFERIFGSDATMKECLEIKGEWHAMSRNSDAFREAQLHHDMGSARRLLQKASKGLERE